MLFEELLESFLYSRRNGLKQVGAKKVCTPQTIANYTEQLKVFFDYITERRSKTQWSSLTRMDMRAFIEFVNNNPAWSMSTKLTYFRSLRTLMNFIEKDADCQHLTSWKQELPAIPKNEQRKLIPSPSDLKKWRASFDTDGNYGYRNYAMFCLFMVCGLRAGELSTLRLNNMQLENRLLYVEGKSGARLVPITNDVVKILKGWLKRRERLPRSKSSDYVFVGHHGERLKQSGIAQVFRKMRRLHNLPRVTAHVTRHAFATYYLRNGGNLERLRIILGHSSFEMVKNYSHLAEVGSEQLKDELETVSPLKMLNAKAGV